MFEHFDYSWDEVHEEAELMEHTMTDRFTERLAEKLGQPSFDPHGDPIPQADGSIPVQHGQPLSSLVVGDKLCVKRILSQESEILTYLFDVGIKPGVNLEIIAIEPFGKLFQIAIGDLSFALSLDLAEQIEGQVL